MTTATAWSTTVFADNPLEEEAQAEAPAAQAEEAPAARAARWRSPFRRAPRTWRCSASCAALDCGSRLGDVGRKRLRARQHRVEVQRRLEESRAPLNAGGVHRHRHAEVTVDEAVEASVHCSVARFERST